MPQLHRRADAAPRRRHGALTKKNLLITAAIALGGLLVALCVFLVAVRPLAAQPTQKGALGTTTKGTTPALQPGEGVEQVLYWPDILAGFSVRVGTAGQTLPHVTLSGVVMDEAGELLCTFEQSYSSVKHRSWLYVPFGAPVQAASGYVKIALSAQGFSAEENSLKFFLSDDASAPCVVSGQEQARSLGMRLYGTSGFVTAYYWAVALPLVLLAALMWLLIFAFNARPQNVFLVAATVLGLCFTFAYPPYAMNDEWTHHIPNTFYYSNLFLGENTAVTAERTFENRAEDVKDGFANTYPQREQYYHIYANLFKGEANPGETVTTKLSLVGQAYQYIPQTLGVTVARVLGMGQVPTLYMGRLFSLLGYVAVLYATIRLVPFKTLFTLLGLVPYTLYLAGGFTYDLSIIMLAYFFIGYVLYLAYTKPRMAWTDILVLAVAGLLLAPLKYIYIPILLLPLIIPRDRWLRPWLKKAFCIVLAAGGVLVLGYYIWTASAYDAAWMPAQTADTPWKDPEGAYTYAALLKDPATLVRLLGATTLDGLAELLLGLGAVQWYELPLWLTCGFAVLLVLSVAPVAGEDPPLLVRRGQKAVMGLSAAGVYLLALVAALTWTYIGAYYIRGAQDRYFVAILPLVVLLARGLFLRRKNNDKVLIYTAVGFNIYAVGFLLLAGLSSRGALRGGV
ncbi:MAG: DUF2142 domain-containing protein [Ruminococcaceae bacterium]|nr:DUF2142 domain-containing protein [Oscillospiraceae bacterium]